MAKKKSKGFIIPSVNFITMTRMQAGVQMTAKDTGLPQPRSAQENEPVDQASNPKIASPGPEQSKPASPKPTPAKPLPMQSGAPGRRRSALSLSSLKRKKEEEELRLKKAREKKKVDLPTDSFTPETFNKVWTGYIESLHKTGEKILASILMADKPELKGHMIHLTYPNQLMKKELLRVRPKVLKHIRKELNNHDVDFVVEVREENAKRFAYTPQEKYELLKEKNKNISLLRKTFNLEL